MFSCFDANPQPTFEQLQQPLRPLRQHLIRVPIRRRHHARNGLRIIVRHSRLEQIAHRVHEHQLGRAPSKRLRQLLRHQPQIKPLLIRMSLDPAKPLRKRLGIAVLAPGADLDATADRVPGCVGPFNGGLKAHGKSWSCSSRSAISCLLARCTLYDSDARALSGCLIIASLIFRR